MVHRLRLLGSFGQTLVLIEPAWHRGEGMASLFTFKSMPVGILISSFR